MQTTLGTHLHPDDQDHVLRAFVHRYARTHVPTWARGTNYMPQFADDADWLAHTRFRTRGDGRLDRRAKFCESSPTWPDGRTA